MVYTIIQVLFSLLFILTVAEDKWANALGCGIIIYLASIAKQK